MKIISNRKFGFGPSHKAEKRTRKVITGILKVVKYSMYADLETRPSDYQERVLRSLIQ